MASLGSRYSSSEVSETLLEQKQNVSSVLEDERRVWPQSKANIKKNLEGRYVAINNLEEIRIGPLPPTFRPPGDDKKTSAVYGAYVAAPNWDHIDLRQYLEVLRWLTRGHEIRLAAVVVHGNPGLVDSFADGAHRLAHLLRAIAAEYHWPKMYCFGPTPIYEHGVRSYSVFQGREEKWKTALANGRMREFFHHTASFLTFGHIAERTFEDLQQAGAIKGNQRSMAAPFYKILAESLHRLLRMPPAATKLLHKLGRLILMETMATMIERYNETDHRQVSAAVFGETGNPTYLGYKRAYRQQEREQQARSNVSPEQKKPWLPFPKLFATAIDSCSIWASEKEAIVGRFRRATASPAASLLKGRPSSYWEEQRLTFLAQREAEATPTPDQSPPSPPPPGVPEPVEAGQEAYFAGNEELAQERRYREDQEWLAGTREEDNEETPAPATLAETTPHEVSPSPAAPPEIAELRSQVLKQQRAIDGLVSRLRERHGESAKRINALLEGATMDDSRRAVTSPNYRSPSEMSDTVEEEEEEDTTGSCCHRRRCRKEKRDLQRHLVKQQRAVDKLVDLLRQSHGESAEAIEAVLEELVNEETPAAAPAVAFCPSPRTGPLPVAPIYENVTDDDWEESSTGLPDSPAPPEDGSVPWDVVGPQWHDALNEGLYGTAEKLLRQWDKKNASAADHADFAARCETSAKWLAGLCGGWPARARARYIQVPVEEEEKEERAAEEEKRCSWKEAFDRGDLQSAERMEKALKSGNFILFREIEDKLWEDRDERLEAAAAVALQTEAAIDSGIMDLVVQEWSPSLDASVPPVAATKDDEELEPAEEEEKRFLWKEAFDRGDIQSAERIIDQKLRECRREEDAERREEKIDRNLDLFMQRMWGKAHRSGNYTLAQEIDDKMWEDREEKAAAAAAVALQEEEPANPVAVAAAPPTSATFLETIREENAAREDSWKEALDRGDIQRAEDLINQELRECPPRKLSNDVDPYRDPFMEMMWKRAREAQNYPLAEEIWSKMWEDREENVAAATAVALQEGKEAAIHSGIMDQILEEWSPSLDASVPPDSKEEVVPPASPAAAATPRDTFLGDGKTIRDVEKELRSWDISKKLKEIRSTTDKKEEEEKWMQKAIVDWLVAHPEHREDGPHLRQHLREKRHKEEEEWLQKPSIQWLVVNHYSPEDAQRMFYRLTQKQQKEEKAEEERKARGGGRVLRSHKRSGAAVDGASKAKKKA